MEFMGPGFRYAVTFGDLPVRHALDGDGGDDEACF